MRRFVTLVRLLSCLALLLGAFGCAATGSGKRPSGEAAAVYKTFLANQGAVKQAPAFSLAGSMSFSRGGKSGRLNYRLYGNYANPVRLDLTTPIGGSYANIREDSEEFTAYVPGRDTVYRHDDAKAGASRLGIPLPFTLREMAAMVTGRFGELAPGTYASAKKTNTGYVYTFTGDPRLSSLTLDFEGKARHLTGRGVEPWHVNFADDEPVEGQRAPVARRITLTTPGGSSLLLRVKSLQPRPTPYPAADMDLPVPSHAAMRSLNATGGETLLPEL